MEELPANSTFFETYWYSPTVTAYALESNSDLEHPGIHCLRVNNKWIFFDKEGVVVINTLEGIQRRIQSTCLELYSQDSGEIAMNPEDTFIYPPLTLA